MSRPLKDVTLHGNRLTQVNTEVDRSPVKGFASRIKFNGTTAHCSWMTSKAVGREYVFSAFVWAQDKIPSNTQAIFTQYDTNHAARVEMYLSAFNTLSVRVGDTVAEGHYPLVPGVPYLVSLHVGKGSAVVYLNGTPEAFTGKVSGLLAPSDDVVTLGKDTSSGVGRLKGWLAEPAIYNQKPLPDWKLFLKALMMSRFPEDYLGLQKFNFSCRAEAGHEIQMVADNMGGAGTGYVFADKAFSVDRIKFSIRVGEGDFKVGVSDRGVDFGGQLKSVPFSLAITNEGIESTAKDAVPVQFHQKITRPEVFLVELNYLDPHPNARVTLGDGTSLTSHDIAIEYPADPPRAIAKLTGGRVLFDMGQLPLRPFSSVKGPSVQLTPMSASWALSDAYLLIEPGENGFNNTLKAPVEVVEVGKVEKSYSLLVDPDAQSMHLNQGYIKLNLTKSKGFESNIFIGFVFEPTETDLNGEVTLATSNVSGGMYVTIVDGKIGDKAFIPKRKYFVLMTVANGRRQTFINGDLVLDQQGEGTHESTSGLTVGADRQGGRRFHGRISHVAFGRGATTLCNQGRLVRQVGI